MTFFEEITEAIREFEEKGFKSVEQLQYWLDRIRKAAINALVPESVLESELNKALGGIYKRLVTDGMIIKAHPGIPRFTVDKLRPSLHAELERRMMASRNLIKLNRQDAVEKAVQRFSGWATSVPDGGSRSVDVKEVKDHVRKSLSQLPFVERRVIIDQGHKFTSNLNEIIAVDSGAIAVIWNSQWRRKGYDYREDHKERDQKVYLLRDNWAQQKGLVKVGRGGYYDQVTGFGVEVFCSCFGQYLYSLSKLPDDMLTIAGKAALADARKKIEAL